MADDEINMTLKDDGTYVLCTETETEYSEEWVNNKISEIETSITNSQTQLEKWQAIKEKMSTLKAEAEATK